MSGQPGSHFAKNSGSVRILGFSDAIVNPLAISSRRNNSRALQVSEVTADLGLVDFQHFDKEADANLVFADEIYQSQAGPVCQCFEEKSDVVFVVCHARFSCVTGKEIIRFWAAGSSFFGLNLSWFSALNVGAKTAEFYLHLAFKIPGLSRWISIKTGLVAASLEQHRIAPNAPHFANALATANFAEAARFVQRQTRGVFRKDAGL